MSREVSCCNISCKHHTAGNGCSVKVNVSSSGACESFEKGFLYYFGIVASAMKENNYIDIHDITDDLRIGLFYILNAMASVFLSAVGGSGDSYK